MKIIDNISNQWNSTAIEPAETRAKRTAKAAAIGACIGFATDGVFEYAKQRVKHGDKFVKNVDFKTIGKAATIGAIQIGVLAGALRAVLEIHKHHKAKQWLANNNFKPYTPGTEGSSPVQLP